MKLDFDAVREVLLVIEDEMGPIDVNKVVFNSSLDSFDKNSLVTLVPIALERFI